MRILTLFFFVAISFGCQQKPPKQETTSTEKKVEKLSQPTLVILGTFQDAGSPHIACKKDCCKTLFDKPDPNRMVVSLGIIDPESGSTYLFEATPDISRQVKQLSRLAGGQKEVPDGVFLTHAHIGHYTGLQYFGKEAMNASRVPVYAMPRMKGFLSNNGPWDLLTANKNIELRSLVSDSTLVLNKNISVSPIEVPHRDEYSETVGFVIQGPEKKALFIPDIDKWEKWDRDISELVKKVDYAFLDATFYHGEEINTRDISQIPHPFIIESMERFHELSASDKAKVHFIHFNHTNPVLNSESEAYKTVIDRGFLIAKLGQKVEL